MLPMGVRQRSAGSKRVLNGTIRATGNFVAEAATSIGHRFMIRMFAENSLDQGERFLK
jgi:hypothetical protein